MSDDLLFFMDVVTNHLDSKRVEDNIKGLQEQTDSKRMEVS